MSAKIKNKKKIIIITILSLFILSCLVIGILYSDSNINGFVGFYGIYSLECSDHHIVKLTSSPIQYLAERNDLENAFDELADTYPIDIDHGGEVIIDNISYRYTIRSFTDSYFIITLVSVNEVLSKDS